MTSPEWSLRHLECLTDQYGLFEHADHRTPRREGGYCVDDVARALVVVSREHQTSDDPVLPRLAEIYLAFLLSAQVSDGRFRNRLGRSRRWEDEASVEDCWGRALWGLGTLAAGSLLPAHRRDAALSAFTRGARWQSPWPRSMAFAALGAAEVVAVIPQHAVSLTLLEATARRIGRPSRDPSWPWPEGRLSYANAVLPEALLAAGEALADPSMVEDGLVLLEWLLQVETRDGRLSVTPVGGRGPGDSGPQFDQQPIEVAALADACARAHALTDDTRWAAGVDLCVQWFLGSNDVSVRLYDPVSGGGCDGLEMAGRNENQGAESTLAALSTLQRARRSHQLTP